MQKRQRRERGRGVVRVLVMTRRVLLVLGTAATTVAGVVAAARAVRDFNAEQPAASCTNTQQAPACEPPQK